MFVSESVSQSVIFGILRCLFTLKNGLDLSSNSLNTVKNFPLIFLYLPLGYISFSMLQVKSWYFTVLFVSAKTCTGLPIINGEMGNITAATGDKVSNMS